MYRYMLATTQDIQMGSLGLTVAVQPVQHDLRIACSNGVAFQRIRRDFFLHVDVVFECPGFARKTFVDYDK